MSSAVARTVRQFARIPEELKADASWVLWRYERRPEKPEKPTKVLRQVNGRHADSTNPATWTTFEAVVEAFERGGFDGIGYVFHPGNPYCGADIDDVTEIEAQGWIDLFDSYAECSPSGNGFHIICKAEVPKGTNREEGELYSSGRFFTMTGDVVRDAPVREAQDAVDEFYTFLRRGDGIPAERTAATPALTDAEVVRLAENAKHGDEFSAIYQGGGHFKSGSERDLSLASRLAFWTQDEAQIERIMRGSGCAREKWAKHRTYLRDTIAKALDGLTVTYRPAGARPRSVASSADPRLEKPSGDVVHVSFNGHGTTRTPHAYNLTDLGNSERFVADHGEGVRYCFPWRKWLVWTGTRWVRDDTSRVQLLAKETVRGIYREAAAAEDEGRRKELAKHATRSEAESKIRAMLELSKAEVPVSPEELDADPWSLNAENGTIDLRTGELREHRREDLITKLAPVHYDPAAEAPRFAQFLREVLVEEILIGFVRRFAGYTLTGSTEERVLAILHGLGKNGKTTLVEVLREVMGEYAANTSTETILTRRNEGVSNDVAALKGARLVSAAEVEQDRRLAESKVKNLTGTDMVTARFLYSEPFDFRPEFKLWLSTNNKPIIRGTDDAIWDRIRLIPFEQRFAGEQRDPKLPEKLREELPGVLAWMVTGCMEWQREGLGEPEKVEKATRGYRAEMDVLASFIEDCCVVDPAAWVKFKDLYAIYQQWCDESGEHPESKQRLGNRLKDRGFEPDRGTGNVPIRRGIGIRDERGTDPESYPASSDRGADENLPKARLGNSAQDAAPGVTPQNTRKTAESGENSYPSYPQIHKPPLKKAREGELQKQGNSGNSGNSEAASEDRSRAPKVEIAAGANLGEWLSEPPDWFRRQADKHLQDPAEATLAALCAAVADAALGDSRRAGEARPRVEAFLRRTEDELLGRGDEDLEGLGDLFGDDDGGTR